MSADSYLRCIRFRPVASKPHFFSLGDAKANAFYAKANRCSPAGANSAG